MAKTQLEKIHFCTVNLHAESFSAAQLACVAGSGDEPPESDLIPRGGLRARAGPR